MQRTQATALALFGVAVFASPALAGPLTPPAGPVTSTMKTLTEVEPRIAVNDTNTPPGGGARHLINAPGSYYLTGDVDAIQRGITIQSDGVTLDLNGFTIRGDGVGTTGDIGILVSSLAGDLPVVIQNGFVEDFIGDGVSTTSSAYNLNAFNVHVSKCKIGFRLLGHGALTDCGAWACLDKGFDVFLPVMFTRCTAESSLFEGFFVNAGAVFRDCIARDNGTIGFSVNAGGGSQPASGNSFTNCLALFNGSEGFHTNYPTTFSECVARDNGSTGFLAIQHASVSNCISEGNNQLGFSLGPGSTIVNSSAQSNISTGISALAHSSVSGCSSHDNATGFNIGNDSTVENCTAIENDFNGFLVGDACTITSCTSNRNLEDGFELGFDCRITNCNADQNTIAGIRGNSDVTIDSNTVTDNGIGIFGGSGGLVIRNFAAGNTTNYNTVGSRYGAILLVSGSFTTTNPFANIEY